MTTRFHTAALLLFTACALTACITLTNCSDDKPTGPPPPPPPDTTSHEFVWEVDTLYWTGTSTPAFFTAKDMYPISATNVYMVGYSTGSDICWHWDGREWSSINVSQYLAGDIVDIDGIDSTYLVLLGGDYGGTHYSSMAVMNNGILETLPIPKGNRPRTCLHVVSRDEIYLGCVQGIQSYDGTKWEWLLDSTETTGNEFYPQYIQKFDDGMLEFVSQDNKPIDLKYMRWKYQDNSFIPIDSFLYTDPNRDNIRFGYRIHESAPYVFATGNGGTFTRKGNQWEKIHNEGGYYLSGTSNNLIIGQGWTNFWHYNGSTYENLWGKMKNVLPEFRRINAVGFIDGVLFVCGEFDIAKRIVVIFRGRQKGN